MVLPYPDVGIVTAASLATDDDVFPILPGRDFIVSKTPTWSTTRHRSVSGRTVRVSNFSAPLWRFSIRHNVLRQRIALPELATLLSFFNTRQGQYGFFFFLDPTDYTVTNQGTGTGDGTTTTFQLIRTLNLGGVHSAVEPVYALWEQPVVKINGTTISTAAYVVNSWGQLVFTTAPILGGVITWSGKFLHVCHFLDDEMSMEQLTSDLWSSDGLEIESDKP